MSAQATTHGSQPDEPLNEQTDPAGHDEPDWEPDTPPPAQPGDDHPADVDPAPLDMGTPTGQLAAGAALVLIGGGWLLYRAGGWLWVAIGAAVLVAAAALVMAAPLVWRRLPDRRPRSTSPRSWPGFGRRTPAASGRASRAHRPANTRSRRDGSRSALRNLLSRDRSRAGGTSPRRGFVQAAAQAVRRLFGNRSAASRNARRGTADHRNRRSAVRRAASAVGRTLARAGRATRIPRAAAWLARNTRAAGHKARNALGRAGRLIDAATGGRLSRAWTRVREARWPRALLERLRRWDEQLTGGLAAAAWSWWGRRRRRHGGAAEHAGDGPSEDDQDTVELPNARTTSPAAMAATTRIGTVMSEFSLITHATELPTIAAEYESDHMMDVRGHMQMLRELPLAAGTAVRIWTERLAADYPLNPDAAEALQRVYDAFGAAVEACDEASVVFEGSHDADIQRQVQPRTNEHRWNHAR